MKRQQLLSVGLVSAVLAVAGCSSSEGSSATTPAPSTTDAPELPARTTDAPEPTTPPTTEVSEPTTPPTTEPPEPTTPTTVALDEPPIITVAVVDDGDATPEIAADKATARTALLTLADFPAGFTETPNESDPNDADNQRFDDLIDDCLGAAGAFDDSFIDERKVETGDFGLDDSTIEASQEVILAPTEADALAAITKIGAPTVPECYVEATQTLFDEMLADPNQTDFPPGMTIGTVEVEFLDYGLPADETVVLFVSIPAELDDTTLDLYFEIWYLRSGRALSQITFAGTNELFPQEGIDALTDLAWERLGAIG